MGLFDDFFVPQFEGNDNSNDVAPFVFVSQLHQRYQNEMPIMGLQNCIRTIRLEKNTNGCRGYDLEPGRGYIVKIWNDDLGKPNMSDKPMDLIKKSNDRWEFRGYPVDAESPFGWVEVDNRDYGFVVFLKNGEIEKCQLHMYDRNTYIEYLKAEVNQLDVDASKAWRAFCDQDYSSLDQYGTKVYNHFVHHPKDLMNLEDPLLIGKVFQVCLGFREQDEDIQEVRAENAFLCFSDALTIENIEIYDEACARLMMLLIRDKEHLSKKVYHACHSDEGSPLSILHMVGDSDLPSDIPYANETKMLMTAYYLYHSIIDKDNVESTFEVMNERRSYINVRNHVLENIRQLKSWTPEREIELGEIIFDKIIERLKKDIELFSGNL